MAFTRTARLRHRVMFQRWCSVDSLRSIPVSRAVCLISTRSIPLHVHIWFISWRFAGLVNILLSLDCFYCFQPLFSVGSIVYDDYEVNLFIVSSIDFRVPDVRLIGFHLRNKPKKLRFPELPAGIKIFFDVMCFCSLSCSHFFGH